MLILYHDTKSRFLALNVALRFQRKGQGLGSAVAKLPLVKIPLVLYRKENARRTYIRDSQKSRSDSVYIGG